MDDVRGDFLRPPHGTTPAAVIGTKNKTEKLGNYHVYDSLDFKYSFLLMCRNIDKTEILKELYKKALKGIFKLKSIFGSMCPKSSVAFQSYI